MPTGMSPPKFLHHLLILACFFCVTTLASPPGPSPDAPPELSEDGCKVLDTWHEHLGVGENARCVTRYKIKDLADGATRIVTIPATNHQTETQVEPSRRHSEPQSKLHPRLVERFLRQADTPDGPGRTEPAGEQTQIVHVWLTDPDESDMTALPSDYHVAVRHRENEPARFATAQAWHAAMRSAEESALRLRGAVRSHFEEVVRDFVEGEGIAPQKIIYRYRYAPAIALRLTHTECVAIGRNPSVNYLFPEEEYDVEMDECAAAVKGPSVWRAGYLGDGAIIADIEPGLMATSNPYLSALAYRAQDSYSTHSTAIGGIIASANADYAGIAPGCVLLNANAASFTGADIIAATEWAIDEGARVLNASFGLKQSGDGELHWSDIYYDYLVHYNHVLFVNSAGNSGDAADEANRAVVSPGRGYNSLSVGAIDSRRTADWTDDVISSFSSYVNPVTGAEKPEIAAYGTNMDATLTESPWIGRIGSGTSFAAPVVAGIAGLIISKDPDLATWPEVVKAKILVSGLAHNIEGHARLSAKDGAGAALATAAFAGGIGRLLTENRFDDNGEFALDMDIPFEAGEPMRIVLVYTYPPSSRTAMPDPNSYLKSDLDLCLFDGDVEVASSQFGTQQPYEIIDYTPPASGTGRIKIRKTSWHPDVLTIRVGVAWASLSTLGTGPDTSEPSDTFAQATPLPGWGGQVTGSNIGAGKETGEPDHAGYPGGHSVWWRWTPSTTGQVTMDVSESDFDALLAVYTGDSIASLTPVGTDERSRCTFQAQTHTPYYVAVDGDGAAQGNIVLTWQIGQTHDRFADAVDLSEETIQIASSNAGASMEPGEPYHAGMPGGASVWWRWTAPQSGETIVNTYGTTDAEMVVGVYTGQTLADLSEVGQNDGLQATFDAIAGTPYYIAVDAYAGNTGDFILNINSQANDDLANATHIPVDLAILVLGSNVRAGKEPGEASHAGNAGGASVWWRWTAPVSGTVMLMTLGSDFDTLLAVYESDSVGRLTEITANDDIFAALGFLESLVEFDAVAGTTYYFAVDGHTSLSAEASTGTILLLGAFDLPPSVPTNDRFADATDISGPSGQVATSNMAASKELGEPSHAGSSGGASLWWNWTAPASGYVSIDTFGSDFDTVLAVYTGNSVGSLTPIASNNDAGGVPQSRVGFDAVAGTIYRIAVDGYYDWLLGVSTGEILLTWHQE